MHTLRDTLPDMIIFLLIIVCAIILDSALHLIGKPAWGRFMGLVGTLIIASSFLYSARKRKYIPWGNPKQYLRLHEGLAWLGSIMILVHGGVHLNTVLPWLPMAALIVVLASGVTGRYLLKRSLAIVRSRRENLVQQGLSPKEVESRLFWDALMVDVMKRWRTSHFVFTYVFLFLTSIHLASIFIFWNWSL
ncbi:MAG: hypothetical protein K9K79_03870 [Desulfohalobiaceae bacterium]|nr:hypothetical protein [Desulfohalobiaceae bacterium]